MTTKAALWARVSTDRQDEQGQVPDLERFCQDHGYEVAQRYELRDRSAYHGEQEPALDKMLADLRAGKFSVIVVWHSDRLTRQGPERLFKLLREVREAGGVIKSVQEPNLGGDDVASEVVTAISGSVARDKSVHLSAQIKRTFRKKRAGNYVVGRRIYGYRLVPNGDGKRLEQDPVEAGYVREAVRRYLDEDVSLRDLCEWLNDSGQRRPFKGRTVPWYPRTLSDNLRNETMCGRRTDAEGVTVHRVDDPILTREIWEALQAKLDRKAARKGIAPKQTAMLTSIARCAKCGGPMYRVNGYQGPSYRCHGTDLEPSRCRNLIPVGELDGWVNSAFMTWPGIADQMVTEIHHVPASSNEVALAENKREFRDLDPDASDYFDRQAALFAERRRLLDGIVPAHDVEDETGETVAQRWARLDTAGRRDYLLRAGCRVLAFGKSPAAGGWRIEVERPGALAT